MELPASKKKNPVFLFLVSAPWYAKPTGEGTHLSPQQFDSSTGHDQPSMPGELICILYLGCCLNV